MQTEVKRRFGHASSAVVPALYISGVITWTQLQYVAIAMSILVVVWEVLRLTVGIDLLRIHQPIRREYEEDSVSSLFWGSLSSTAVVLWFEPTIALPAVLMMMLADPISGLLSTDELRKIKHPPAIVSMFTACVLIAVPYLTIEAALIASLGATVADSAKPRIKDFVVDDNLSIPIVAAVAGYVGMMMVPSIL